MNRRLFMGTALASMIARGLPVAAQGGVPSLLEVARATAAQDYVAPSGVLPPPFAGLDYDAFRGIRPIVGEAALLPQGGSFAVDLLPPGLYFPDPVTVERQVDGAWADLPLTPELFDFDPRYFDSVPQEAPGAGFSGLRLRYPLNAPDVMDEVAVFQGASYFRAIGQAMAYGLSARAVALGTGGATPEEFPRFTHMRLHEGGGGSIRMEALIDSPSLSGHFDMELFPGMDTGMNISVTLFPRVRLDSVGIAPLTSMYLKGPMRGAASDDFRPRVHDSDVLFIENGAGERLWRPIGNPAAVETSAFSDNDPRAFGLFQTARTYEDFEDTEARYEIRPSAIIGPLGNWGPGAVMLVEIPTGTEFLDNIVAFWRPEAALEAGGEYRFRYRLDWTLADPDPDSPAQVIQSRSGREHEYPGTRRFVIDFTGSSDGLVPDLSVSGEGAVPDMLDGIALFNLPDGRGQRATFLLTPGNAARALEVRLVLRDAGGAAVSPVWLHRWTRKRDGRE
ncbi:glucan biosynthesis protein [Gymnodinialimonas hymeniacidonis]|uniref:glucan biosynthesis protein n=1 Tax=Gymnodinialimonas hymeniacidonis TaxID=3126508 RepID=UPI0034C60E98